MVDEMHVKPYFDYKCGNIVEMAFDGKKASECAVIF